MNKWMSEWMKMKVRERDAKKREVRDIFDVIQTWKSNLFFQVTFIFPYQIVL